MAYKTNDASYTSKFKAKTAMAKAKFTSILDLVLRKKC